MELIVPIITVNYLAKLYVFKLPQIITFIKLLYVI